MAKNKLVRLPIQNSFIPVNSLQARFALLTNSHSKRLKIYKNTLAYCVEALVTVQKRFINSAAVCQRSDLHPGVNAIKLFLLH
jgi:hypothetical protein